jgi:hypothetical protein
MMNVCQEDENVQPFLSAGDDGFLIFFLLLRAQHFGSCYVSHESGEYRYSYEYTYHTCDIIIIAT